ncbi:MAG: cyclic nucleotide-binding domain-containing protein [Desulfobacteraceae bacterium]|nr:cyclic nucleotide-binding domain-containing protein [Desulfobacteraceae bacterium]
MVKIEDLKKINLLNGLPDELLEIIAPAAQLSIFNTDTILFEPNEDIDTFYMLVMGQVALKVALSDDVHVILDSLQSGASFGVASLVPGTNPSSTAVCQEPCEVITLNSKKMTLLFEENPELGYQVMRRLAIRYKKKMNLRTNMIMKTLELNPELKTKIDDIETLTPIF